MNEETAISLMKSVWPEYSAVLGDASIRRLARNVSEGTPSERLWPQDSGTPFDLKDALTIAGHILTFLKLAFDAYKLLKERRDKRITTEAITEEVEKRALSSEVVAVARTEAGQRAIVTIIADQ